MEQETRRGRKREETRKKILESAFRLFIDNGFDNTSVDQITTAADIGKGTFYNYFSNKEAVLYDLMEKIGKERGDKIWPSIMKCDDTRQRLIKAFEGVSAWFEKYPELAKTYMQQSMRISDTRDQTTRRHNNLELYLAEILKMGQDLGDIRDDLDVMQLVYYLCGIFLIEVIAWYESGVKEDLDERLKQGVDFFLIGALSTK